MIGFLLGGYIIGAVFTYCACIEYLSFGYHDEPIWKKIAWSVLMAAIWPISLAVGFAFSLIKK